MTTGADKPNCPCCGTPVIFGDTLCLWCKKDDRRYALFELIPVMQKWFGEGKERGFCRCCKKYKAGYILIDRFLVWEWLKDSLDDDVLKNGDMDDSGIAAFYAPRERKALMDNRCTCIIDECECLDDDEYNLEYPLVVVQQIEKTKPN